MNSCFYQSRAKLCSLCVALLCLYSSTVSSQAIDEVVLVIDSTAITAREFSVLRVLQDQSLSYAVTKPKLGDQITTAIINEQVLASHARLLSPDTRISASKVDAAILNLAQQNNLAPADLLRELQAQGVDIEIFRDSLKTRLLVQEVISNRVASSITITDAQVQNYISSRPELRKETEQVYRASHLVIPLKEGLSEEEIEQLREVANDLRNQLLLNGTFEDIIANNELAQSSTANGDLGWKKQGELPSAFVNALKNMQQGGISSVLETSNGFHLLGLQDVRSANAPEKQYRVQHIVKAVTSQEQANQAKVLLQNLKSQILVGIDFASLARNESDDPATKNEGGELGWVTLKELGPEIGAVIKDLEIGEISDPVQSQVGVHLIKVSEIRDLPGEISLEARVKQRLFSDEMNEKMEDLLNDIKQIALIEVVE